MHTDSKSAQAPWWATTIRDDIVMAQAATAIPASTRPERPVPTTPAVPAAPPAVALAPATAPGVQERLDAIEARAEKGDVSAMKFLSNLYLNGGDGIEKSIVKAHVWLIKAAREQNDGEAYFQLGQLYELGHTVDGQANLHAAGGAYMNSAKLGYEFGQQNFERIAAKLRPVQSEVARDAAPSSFSFGDFLRGVGKVVGAVGMVAGARYNDPGMVQQGAALIGGDANEIARTQAAQNARQQAAQQAQSSGGAGRGDCAQFARNRDIARRNAAVAGSSFTSERDMQLRVAQANENAYQACISQ